MILVLVLCLGFSLYSKPAIANSQNLFFSEYIEGTSYNKALEIYNPTVWEIDLSIYVIEIYFNGSTTPSNSTLLIGSILPNTTHVICHTSFDPNYISACNQLSGNINFNGNDAIVLKENGNIIDIIGEIGTDPEEEWGEETTSTQNNTLIRNCNISQGNPNPKSPFGPDLEWSGLGCDNFSNLGTHNLCLPTQTPTPTSTPTPTPTSTPTPTATLTPTNIPTPTPSPYKKRFPSFFYFLRKNFPKFPSFPRF